MGWLANAYVIICKGGPIMAPLMACSMLSIAIMIERFLTLRSAGISSEGLMSELRELIRRRDIKQALRQAEAHGGFAGCVLAAGLKSRSLRPDYVERAMQEEASKRTPELHRRLSILDTIITIAPLLGLLGTVVGMIKSFHVVSSKQGMSAPTAITGGVAEALIATAAGLAIAITTLIGYNYLNDRVSRVISDTEAKCNELVNMVSEMEESRHEITALSA